MWCYRLWSDRGEVPGLWRTLLPLSTKPVRDNKVVGVQGYTKDLPQWEVKKKVVIKQKKPKQGRKICTKRKTCLISSKIVFRKSTINLG